MGIAEVLSLLGGVALFLFGSDIVLSEKWISDYW